MASLKENFDKIISSIDEKAAALGFEKLDSGKDSEVWYTGEKGAIKVICDEG